jgi:putative ABC transport system permease protein
MLRSVLREQTPTLAFDSLLTMDERVMQTLAKPRLYAIVVTALAVFAVAIAGVGLFGVLSYSVAQRSREIGVHVALGARPVNVLAIVVRHAALIAAAGISVGLWLAFASTRWLTTVIFGIAPHDVMSFVAVPLLLMIVVVLATIAPAVRAIRLDPIRVLRAPD